MALQGMTGFGRAEGEGAGVRWAWEARSVNGRGLDLKTRLPPGFEALEPAVREQAGKRFKRGSVQISLSVKQDVSVLSAPKLNLAFIEALIAAGQPFVDSGRAAPPRWDGLLLVRGATGGEEASEPDALYKALERDLIKGLSATLDSLAQARAQEGRSLAALFGDLLTRIETLVGDARASAAAQPGAIQEKIKARLDGLSPDIAIDPQRLAQEAAIAAMRADVQEELERLAAHASETRALLLRDEPAGRRLDFLTQEFGREANTLCSKSQDLALTRIGLDLKTAIDQLKEQAANVE